MKPLKFVSLLFAFILATTSSFAQKSHFTSNNIGKIVTLYLDIKNALINDDGTTAKIKANDLYQVLSDQPDRGLEWRQVQVLADNLQTLLDNTKQICYTVNEGEQRVYFARLTDGVYHIVKDLRLNNKVLYKQYSPLNNAYWLSETQVIKNPYYNYYYKPYASLGKTTEVLPKSILAN